MTKLSQEMRPGLRKNAQVDDDINQELSNVTAHDLPCLSPVLITKASLVPTLRTSNRLSEIMEKGRQELGIGEILAISVGALLLCTVMLYFVFSRKKKTSTLVNNGKICKEDDVSHGKVTPDVENSNYNQVEISKSSSFIAADSKKLAKISSVMNVHSCGMYPCSCCSKTKMTKFVQVGKNNRYPQIENGKEAGPSPFVSMDLEISFEDNLDEHSLCTVDNQTMSNNIDRNDGV
jgi:hypothetical protein